MNALDISASALSAQRTRMTAIAGNIANANTTRDEYGRKVPYRRLEVLFAAGAEESSGKKAGIGGKVRGVKVTDVRPARDPFRWVHDPAHPDAVDDPNGPMHGHVLMPRINAVQEMVDMMLASRAYEANLSSMEVTKAMASAALRIIA